MAIGASPRCAGSVATPRVSSVGCDLAVAVLGVLARTQNRPFAAIEEALLVHELVQGLGPSQHGGI